MSGATGAGSAGRNADGGGRGSAAQMMDSHTTNLKAIKPSATGSKAPEAQPSQGGSVTDTKGPGAQRHKTGPHPAASGAATPTQPIASPLPVERRQTQPSEPYHPPQAYPVHAQAYPADAQAYPADAVRRPSTGVHTLPRTRKARLRVAKADPWSVMKVSFLLSIALGICTIVASAVLWMVMDAMGVFSTVGSTISEATSSNESNAFDLQSFLSLPRVLIFTSIIAIIDVVLATALLTLGAFIYNLSAGFAGGIELTLAEDE